MKHSSNKLVQIIKKIVTAITVP